MRVDGGVMVEESWMGKSDVLMVERSFGGVVVNADVEVTLTGCGSVAVIETDVVKSDDVRKLLTAFP